jgi:aminopeptidase N
VLAVGAAGAAPSLAGGVVGTPGADGIGDPYFPLDGNGGYDVQSYDVHDRYHFGTGRLAGWTTVTLTATQDLSSFHLDFLLPVDEVLVDGMAAGHARPDNDHELVVTPATGIPAGTTVEVRVSYAGRPGEVSWRGESNWLADRHEVVAMNEPHMAPWWFPANDHPLDKAAMDISIRVPADRQVIANGERAGRTVHADGTATTSWHAGEPMAPYLAFFAAGRFAVDHGTTAGIPWYVAASEQLPARGTRAAMKQLRRSAGIVDWLQGQLVDYPFAITGGLVTDLPAGFALENQTRPTYWPLGRGSTGVLVHELAHQWFGDSVSVHHWRDVWLNEGAATFMQVRWTETHGGPSAQHWLHAWYDGYPAGSRFWDLTIGDPGRNRIFDGAVYTRGAMALQALRHRIGNDAFWTTIRTWLTDRADGNGSTEDFRALAESTSGEDLASFFTAWFFTGAKPDPTAANGLD